MNLAIFPALLLVAAAAWYWRRVRPRIRRLEATAAAALHEVNVARQIAQTYDAALLQHAAQLQWVRDVRAAVGVGVID